MIITTCFTYAAQNDVQAVKKEGEKILKGQNVKTYENHTLNKEQ